MSAASERARALLGAATQGRWEIEDPDGAGIPRPVRLMLGPRISACLPLRNEDGETPALIPNDDERVEDSMMENAALIAEACSPEGGLLATLAGEVEALEGSAEALADAAWHAPSAVAQRASLEGRVRQVEQRHENLRAENARLRALLRRVEWAPGPFETRNCPGCGGLQTFGHAPDCELAAALKG